MSTLYIVSTPIGNLDDITLRAIDILKKSDIIACENPNKSQKLLNKLNIRKKLIKYNEGNKEQAVQKILKYLKNNKNISYISDAGTPGISDPGYRLINKTIELNFPIVPVPGASALTTFIMGSGIPTDKFMFQGFLPKKTKKIKDIFYRIKSLNITTIFYISKHNIYKFITLFKEIFGNREIVIGRELTKLHEEFIRGKINDIEDKITNNIKGEYTIAIPKIKYEAYEDKNNIIEKALKLKNDFSPSDISKILSKLYDINRREIYNLLKNI